MLKQERNKNRNGSSTKSFLCLIEIVRNHNILELRYSFIDWSIGFVYLNPLSAVKQEHSDTHPPQRDASWESNIEEKLPDRLAVLASIVFNIDT